MILGIDASNIRAGGGLTHLVELLGAADPVAHDFSRVVVWSGRSTLSRIEDRDWLIKCSRPLLDKGVLHRSFWQRFKLSTEARRAGCDVLFMPGGSNAGDFRPLVTMSQNMLPFEWRELRRYGWDLASLRLILLRWSQSSTFRRAQGLIFLTEYAHDTVLRAVRTVNATTTIIPHGIDAQFVCPPREQLPVGRYSVDVPFRIVYVSIVNVYKHQWHVAEAVATLWRSGLPVILDLIGPAYPPAFTRLKRTLERVDPGGHCVRYHGSVPHAELHKHYQRADLCVFASSCENLPNILLEAMASGLPIACSNHRPMPEVLADAGVYFDPESPQDIARALRELIDSSELRTRLAKASFDRSQVYSWTRCARETFEFLSSTANGGRPKGFEAPRV